MAGCRIRDTIPRSAPHHPMGARSDRCGIERDDAEKVRNALTERRGLDNAYS